MTDRRLLLDGETLSLEEIREVSRGDWHVALAPEALIAISTLRGGACMLAHSIPDGAGHNPFLAQYGYPGVPPNNYLVWSILVLILCCVPAGIVSLVYSTQVNSKWAQGDVVGAQNSSTRARQWAMWGAIATGVGALLYVVFVVILVAVVRIYV